MLTVAIMNPGLMHSFTFMAVAAVVLLASMCRACLAQERAAGAPAGTYPYAGQAIAAQKSLQHNSSAVKMMNAPVLNTIAPDAPRIGSISLPEHQSAIDQMLQSHEFTFNAKQTRKALGFAKTQPGPTGTNLDLDAVKLRISRDKILIKAEWTFN
jgi:hypothetical protein